MFDRFKKYSAGLNSPASSAFQILPDDATTLVHVTRAIYVGRAGDLAIEMADGQAVTFTAVQPGMIYPIRCNRVYQTGTTASGIIGLF